MKLIIDIPEKEFGIDINNKFQNFFNRLKVEIKERLITNTSFICGAYELETIDMLLKAFNNGISITDNVTNESGSENPNKCFDGITNGEVIRVLFPNLYSYDGEDYVLLDLSGFCGGKIEKNWWDAPYKAESEEV